MQRIPVAQPTIGHREKELVETCMTTGWISSVGKYVDEFESAFAKKLGVKHAISVSNGTLALHLALMGMELSPGDEVIVPAVTYVATANAVRYCGAEVRLADVDPATMNVTPETVAAAITPRTKVIMPVHLFGIPCDMDGIMKLAAQHGLKVVEDSAEAVGATWRDRSVGTLGDAGMFSFFGNKTITTGEGGMMVTNNDDINARCRLLRGQGMSPERRYWHTVVGYNYRMTNICAAIGLGQLEQLDDKIATRRRIRETYLSAFDAHGIADRLILPFGPAEAFDSVWMINIVLKSDVARTRDEITMTMDAMGIETRPTFYPLYEMPPYADLAGDFPGAQAAARGITLPTYEALEANQIDRVAQSLATAIER